MHPALRAELKKVPLRPAPTPRNSARLALVVVGDLPGSVYPAAPDQEARRRVSRTIRAHEIGRVIVDGVAAVHEARTASADSRFRAINESRHWRVWTGSVNEGNLEWALSVAKRKAHGAR